MLTPPADLTEAALLAALAQGWGLDVASLEYQPVGWGSHHWDVTDAAGARWVVTVDDLESTAEFPDQAGQRRGGRRIAACHVRPTVGQGPRAAGARSAGWR